MPRCWIFPRPNCWRTIEHWARIKPRKKPARTAYNAVRAGLFYYREFCSVQHRQLHLLGEFIGLLSDLPHQNSGGDGALTHAAEVAQEHQRQHNGDAHQGHVKTHLHIAELHRGHLADGQHNALPGGGHQVGHHLYAHPKGDEHNAQGAVAPGHEIAGAGQRGDDPLRQVDGEPEENGGRELQYLEPVVVAAENGDLNEDKEEIHNDGGGPHRQAGNFRGDIGHTGDGGGAQPRFDGKGHAKGHDHQSQAQKEDAPQGVGERGSVGLSHGISTFQSLLWETQKAG